MNISQRMTVQHCKEQPIQQGNYRIEVHIFEWRGHNPISFGGYLPLQNW